MLLQRSYTAETLGDQISLMSCMNDCEGDAGSSSAAGGSGGIPRIPSLGCLAHGNFNIEENSLNQMNVKKMTIIPTKKVWRKQQTKMACIKRSENGYATKTRMYKCQNIFSYETTSKTNISTLSVTLIWSRESFLTLEEQTINITPLNEILLMLIFQLKKMICIHIYTKDLSHWSTCWIMWRGNMTIFIHLVYHQQQIRRCSTMDNNTPTQPTWQKHPTLDLPVSTDNSATPKCYKK